MKYYNVIFKDGSTIELEDTKGEIIYQAWMDGKRVPFDVDGDGYLVSDIKRMIKQSRTESREPVASLPQGNRCKGKRSIQLEISKRIRKEYPHDWPKAMRDSTLRNVYRVEILEEGGEWCDFVAGTCVCDRPDAVTGPTWAQVFPEGKEVL